MTVATTRWLVPVEIAALLALAAAYAWHPFALPSVVPLFALASASRWSRGGAWDDLVRGSRFTGLGALAGLTALALALAAGTPLVELTGRAVEWSQYPVVRGSMSQLGGVAVLVALLAVVAELGLRGGVVERALALGARPPVAIGLGALAEALVWPGDIASRLGAAVLGAGLGWIYVAAGRTLGAPLAARVLFALGALVLEGLRLIG